MRENWIKKKLENNLQGVQVIPHLKDSISCLDYKQKEAEKGKSRSKYFIEVRFLNSNSKSALIALILNYQRLMNVFNFWKLKHKVLTTYFITSFQTEFLKYSGLP